MDALSAAPPGRPITGWHCVPRCQGPDRAPRQNVGSISDSCVRYSLPQGTNCGGHRMPRPWPCLTPISWSLKHWTRHLLLPHSGSEARALGNRRNGNLRARRTAPKPSGICQETELHVLLPKCLWMRPRGKDQSRNFLSLQLRCSPPKASPPGAALRCHRPAPPPPPTASPGLRGQGGMAPTVRDKWDKSHLFRANVSTGRKGARQL